MQDDELPDCDRRLLELVAELPLEKRLAGLTVEQRLAGLTPEERRVALASLVLVLPDEVLRGLTDECLASLPESVRAAVRARLGR